MIGADEQPRTESTDETRPSSAQPASAGSSPAERWVAEHGDVLWRFALGRTRSKDAAEEIVQETILAAMQAFDSFAGDSSERTWLLGIAAHKITDHFRRLRRHHTAEAAAPTDDLPELRTIFTAKGKWARTPGGWGAGADNEAENTELREALRRCIDALPPALAETVWLRDILGVPAQEVCKAMGLTPTNLWTRAHRARAALRQCVEKSALARKGDSR